MPNTPAPLAPTLGAAFRVGDALEAGHSRGRMLASDLERPFRGARRRRERTPPPDDEPLSRDRAERERVLREARAYLTVAPRGAFLAGRSAAVALALPCDAGPDLCVGVLAPARGPRAHGIHGMKLSPWLTSIGSVGGVPVTSPATTWAMLSGEVEHDELVAMGDAIVRVPRDDRGRPQAALRLGTVEQLLTAALAPHRRGRARLLDALADIRVGSMSVLETDYRLLAGRAGLPEPVLDVEIRSASGALIGIADAVYPAYSTLVEIEGDHHRTSRQQWQRDIAKHAAYVAAGWEVVRVTSGDIRGYRPRAAEIVAAVLRRHGWAG